jgi:hypothetical protein
MIISKMRRAQCQYYHGVGEEETLGDATQLRSSQLGLMSKQNGIVNTEPEKIIH